MAVSQLKDGRWAVVYRVDGKQKWEYFGRGLEAERTAKARNEELKTQGLINPYKKNTTHVESPLFSTLAMAYLKAKSIELPKTLIIQILVLPRDEINGLKMFLNYFEGKNKMLIKIYTKNMALKKELEIKTNNVPRVGETLFFEIDDSVGGLSHIVHDISYFVDGQKMEAVVSCHEASPNDHRKIILEEHGWI